MKQYKNIAELQEWQDNPRGVKKDDFKRLKKQIKELGQYKPLLINQDNIVLGGNMRLKAYKELGIDKVWVSQVTTKSKADMIRYALSDNDRVGYYEDQALAELIQDIDIDLEDYKVDLGHSISLDRLLKQFTGDDINFDDIQSTEDRERQFKDMTVTCPNCNKSFDIKV